jgi:hypothetical protein
MNPILERSAEAGGITGKLPLVPNDGSGQRG